MNLKDGFHADGSLQSPEDIEQPTDGNFAAMIMFQNFLLRNFYTEVEVNRYLF